MSIPPIRPVRDAKHSLFQSAVAAYVRSRSGAAGPAEAGLAPTEAQGTGDDFTAALASPLVQAASAAAQVQVAGQTAPPSALEAAAPADVSAATLAKSMGEALAAGNAPEAARLAEEFRKVSDADYAGWIISGLTYFSYLAKYQTPLYRDWNREGKGDRNYSVIEWKLPDNARVGILGDWATNLDDARGVLTAMKQKGVDAVIHLGDVYYSGTPDECTQSLRTLRDVLGPAIPVFTIPGNHEYYSFGHGFYPMLDALNTGIPGAQQPASYFCLRTQDGAWQFLAMDTGYNGRAIPAPATSLVPSEAAWHRDKLETFAGTTILLSHHQLFTANDDIPSSSRPWLNENLLGVFQPYFDRVAAWLWGHEHNLVLYANGLMGLQKGRLIGASAYEEAVSEHPYVPKYPAVPYLDPARYRLDAAEGYYNHSYAIIDFGTRKAPQDPVSITYYQYPSWAGFKKPYPAPPANEEVFTETLDPRRPASTSGTAHG